ncbi:carotenoid biosynthesis protein [Conexibacter sp. SYSU D00693]|uniref:carotenoid biosynthesis protein n=1 Tax=Conexibacter sp. SYSU D00693 TaxID=2812560 RepID=UPI00196A7E19|nr:carotenoid biosynthesis protein [Conexibacter sp. SYSU D00693]
MRSSRLLAGAVVGVQLVYPAVPARWRVRATQAVMGVVAAAAVQSLRERVGGRRAAAMVACSAGVGTVAEVVGVRTGRPFGRYAYGDGLGPKVLGVPPGVPVAWTMLSPAAWSVAGLVARSPAARVATAAGALTAWDVHLDPRMVREGHWRWPGGGAYAGVPLSNFGGWFVTGLGLFGLWALLDGDGEPDDADLVLYLWTWVGETVAGVRFWGAPGVAAAGFAAMGAFAVPALRARLARG